MKGKAIIVFSLLLFSIFLFNENSGYLGAKALNTYPVHNISTGLSYSSIQEAIDAPQTFGGNTILVDAGTYEYNTTVDVDKSLAIIGSGRDTTVIDGGGESLVVYVDANDVLFEGFNVENGIVGVYVGGYSNCILQENSVTDIFSYENFGYAIWAVYTENLTVNQNIVGPNNSSGILVSNSLNFTVSGNYVHDDSGYGINANASSDGLITGNNAYRNFYDGIGLSAGSHDVTITGNDINNNTEFGVDVIDSDCVNNLIYDNNIVNNGNQASVSDVSENRWDNGVEGNYWSNYTGVDQYHDGIGDAPYVLSADDADNYPLMGPISVFATSLGFDVDVVSNSSIASFAYFLWNGTVVMQVETEAGAQIYGFCRVRLPHGLLAEPYSVTVDGADPLYLNTTVFDDGVSRWIYFLYQQGIHEVVIRGRSPPVAVSIISPENKTYTASDVPFAFTVNEETSLLAYSLDGRANVTITGNVTLSGVSNGNHTLELYARNSFGDTSASGIVHFTVSVAGFGVFPFLVAAAVAVVVVLAVVLVYFRKLRRKRAKKG